MKRKRWILAGLVLFLIVSMPRYSFGEQVSDIENQDDTFTDTDMRRGMLAVRCDTFQGFGGTVELKLKGQENDKEITILLTKESGYLANQELLPQIYQIEELSADSGGRRFECETEDFLITIETDRISIFRITVEPGSVYLVPYEEKQEIDPETATMAQIDERNADSTIDAKQSEEMPKTDADGYRYMILCLALLGMAVSLCGIVFAVRRHGEEG